MAVNEYPRIGSNTILGNLSFIGKYDLFAVIVYFPYYTRARVILGYTLERASGPTLQKGIGRETYPLKEVLQVPTTSSWKLVV